MIKYRYKSQDSDTPGCAELSEQTVSPERSLLQKGGRAMNKRSLYIILALAKELFSGMFSEAQPNIKREGVCKCIKK
jgi:hypothetical protein